MQLCHPCFLKAVNVLLIFKTLVVALIIVASHRNNLSVVVFLVLHFIQCHSCEADIDS